MRFVQSALLVLLLGVSSAFAGESGVLKAQDMIGRPLAAARTIVLAPGALGSLKLGAPGRSLVVSDSRVANGYIAHETLALITAKSPGKAQLDIRDAEGRVIESFELHVQQPSGDITGSLPREAGPSLNRTPTLQDLSRLMGPRFRLRAATSARQAKPSPVALLAEGGTARPPIGWHQFCRFYSSECATADMPPVTVVLDDSAWKELVAINDAVNQRIEPVSDMEHHDIIEHWDYPMDGKGDCEDYALLKRRLLLDAGWPRQALLMTVVRDRKGDGHAVLTVSTDIGDFILDNQYADIVGWNETGYRFVKRQARDNPNHWVELNAVDTNLVAFSGAARE